MWALKIGGSILHATPGGSLADACDALIDDLRSQPAGCLLVPGGGRHADAVREAQAREGFDDDSAHVRALVAVDDCAAELAARLGSSARVVVRLADAFAAVTVGVTPIWAPHADLAGDLSVPRNWGLTSDSLAAIAAQRLQLKGVCLLKACDVPAHGSAQTLADLGIVDVEWPRWVAGLSHRVLGPGTWAARGGLQAALREARLAAP